MRAKGVRVFVADGCHLCEAALEVVSSVCSELGVPFEEVDISVDAELERRYRERIPVVVVGGDVAFTYFVDPQALRQRLRA
jgi:glutaredoxin